MVNPEDKVLEAEKDVVCEALTSGLDEVMGRWAHTVAGNLLLLTAKALPPTVTTQNIGRVMHLVVYAMGLLAKLAAEDIETDDTPKVVLP